MGEHEPTEADLQQVRRWLASPENHEPGCTDVEQIETHISWVFLTRDFAYKLKKPVRFDFLDFSSLERRRAACQAEVRLNARLAADVYLGVVPLCRDPQGEISFDGEGATLAHVVQMRRLPRHTRLDVQLAAQGVGEEALRRLSGVLKPFYASADPLPLEPAKYLADLEHHVRDNRQVLLEAVEAEWQPLVRRVEQAQLAVLRLRGELLRERVAGRRVVDGHGDLRPEHVYLTEPPVVIDCIEFSDEFRRIDIADELCFFAVECERLDHPSVGEALLGDCLPALQDEPEPLLLAFYKCYRASVRAKVAALRSGQLAGTEKRKARREEHEYLELADRHSRAQQQPLLLAVGGAMGTGKSTLAGEVAALLGMTHLQTDVVRQQLFPPEPADEAEGKRHPAESAANEGDSFGQGKYSPQHRDRVYREMLSQAEAKLEDRESVAVDGTFLSRRHRSAVRSLAERLEVPLLQVECRCDPQVARQRIARRQREGAGASEARPEQFDLQLASADPVEAEETILTIDSTLPLEQQTDLLLKELAKRWQPAE